MAPPRVPPGKVGGEQGAEQGAEAAAKKQKGTLFAFVTKHAAPPAKIAATRKPHLNTYTPKKPPPKPIAQQPGSKAGLGRGGSKRKQGSRKNDVSEQTLHKRVKENPGHHLRVSAGQLYCGACNKNIGSSKQERRVAH